ncbi:DUF1542 domain-containing protein, partial [Enterococcus faecalis]|uniref:DUF1542 domain-containing protein n=1 Tax=Enterococcus faecalis TaxID=1351 RepID=UPI0013D2EF8C
IDEAKDIDGVNQAKAAGIKAMDDQHKSGDPVDNRKEAAKADIDAAAAKVKGEIDADGTLTAEEKGKQKAVVDQEAEKAKKAIDEAKDIDGVNQAKAAGIKAMDDQHKSGDPVDNRKEAAKADIDAAAAKVKGEIDADGTLTAEEKGKQKAVVDQEAEKVKKAIDEAKDIDGVNQAKAAGIKAMDDQHKSGNPVDNRKEAAKADIDAAAAKVKGKIDADGTLTAE